MSSSEPTGIAVFASGTGSNALKIIEHFAGRTDIMVRVIISNNPSAGVLAHAYRNQIPALVITRRLLSDQSWLLRQLEAMRVDRIVLAGFLLLLPEFLVQAFPGKIVNIHPALLPKYGGKGMYGRHVHEAVKSAEETTTGITIHIVNEVYDDGLILFQAETVLDPTDTPESIAQKVHVLEHQWYPRVIDHWIQDKLQDM